MKLIFKAFIITLIVNITACNHTDNSSPYNDLLIQPPYSTLTDSIKDNSGNDNLYFRRGLLLRKNELIEPALDDFQKAWSLKNKEQYAAIISAILVEKKPDSAIIFIKNALQKIPSSTFLKLDLVRAYRSLNENEKALAVCNNIIEITPGQIDALMMQSELLEEKKDTLGSVASLEKAYSLAPFDLELNYNLAFRYAQNRNAKTISLCDSLLKMDSAHVHAEPYYFKGVYYSNINEKDKAINFFNLAIQHDYNFLDAYLDKGRTLYEQKKINDALKVFTLASSVSPAYADAYYWTGKCLQALGQKDEAKENYRRAYGFDKTLTEAKDSADKIK
ncbi:MAG: hypothetical protein JWM28_1419 [Chitinophagaceae bacterium]|nr:hypothetical protein [Chitinophagaceae bacterium]